MQLFCECARPSCLVPILVEPEFYDAVRGAETLTIVAPSHVRSSADVRRRSHDYWVVQERP
jgi:hypothetical protein